MSERVHMGCKVMMYTSITTVYMQAFFKDKYNKHAETERERNQHIAYLATCFYGLRFPSSSFGRIVDLLTILVANHLVSFSSIIHSAPKCIKNIPCLFRLQ